MADPVEVELKYRVTAGPALERLVDGDWIGDLAAGAWRTFELEDRYLDTADGALARGGYAARLRRQGDAVTLTLKSLGRGEGPGGTLFRRVELEGPANDDLRPTAWPESEARRRLMALAGVAPLVPRFTLRQQRRERDLRAADGWAVLSLDTVRVEVGGADIGGGQFVEIEARGGSERLLHEVGAMLESSGGVTPEGRSKEALAVELLAAADQPRSVRPWGPEARHETPPDGQSPAVIDAAAEAAPVAAAAATPVQQGAAESPAARAPRPRSPRPRRPAPRPAGDAPDAGETDDRAAIIRRLRLGRTPGVLGEDALAEAGRKVLRFHFARMLEREAGTREGRDLEDLHAMRVATRRMRAAWRVFGDGFRPRPRRRYVAELRTVATALGDVRDQDVLIDGLTAYMAALTPEEAVALAPLMTAWYGVRAAARERLVRLLDGTAYGRFVDDYVAFVETAGTGGRAVRATDPHRVRDTAPSRIWAAYEQLRAYDASLAWADVTTLHALRIVAKRMRYTLEFFREVLGADGPTLITRVTTLQDHLGLLHDADVAAHLAREYLAGSAAGLTAASIQAVGRYLASREREVARLRRTLPAAWRPLVNDTFRRALGRAVSVL